MKDDYTIQQIKQELAMLSRTFDIVRLVDPIANREYKIEDGKFSCKDDYICYSVWGRDKRCENCVSARCKHDGVRRTKFEFTNHDMYTVIAKPVRVEGKNLIMEIVSNLGDNVMLESFEQDGYLDKITSFTATVYNDALTGVHNRRYLDEQMFTLCNRFHYQSIAYVMIDLDNFKHVNDAYGHQQGDAILQVVATRLMELTKENDNIFVARYGGDEFSMVCHDISFLEIQTLLHDLVTKKELLKTNAGVSITLSVGGVYTTKHHVPEKLMKAADRILYLVKEHGKGDFLFVQEKV